MWQYKIDLSVAIFALTLVATFIASLLGRLHTKRIDTEGLAGQRLNKWLVGLSAGAAANSGFVVTGAVGLGYTAGAQWLLLPLAWLLGDLVFWSIFPGRINRAGAEANASTLTDVLVFRLDERSSKLVKRVVGTAILVCLSGYVSAQWLSGEKFLRGAFGFEGLASLAAFAAVIVVYTAIGGFRGSIYSDAFQAVLRIIGTIVALAAVFTIAGRDIGSFRSAIDAAGPTFLNILPGNSVTAAAGFVLGYAAAALGFGLGQPQIVTRYLAGASPAETRAAWWIYIAFVQFTWISMTLFGMALRGIIPSLDDPEAGLSVFFRTSVGPLLTGIIVADIFATIAATSNSLLVAMAQTLKFDLVSATRVRGHDDHRTGLWPYTALLGAATMVLSLISNASVVSLALTSVSLLGAGIAPAMLARTLGVRQSGFSILSGLVVGFGVATSWKLSGLGAIVNEAAPGLLAGLVVNLVAAQFAPASSKSI
ncbi:MAG: hypothetical protein WAW96_12895 [Alphaproteobacteria bacterium]